MHGPECFKAQLEDFQQIYIEQVHFPISIIIVQKSFSKFALRFFSSPSHFLFSPSKYLKGSVRPASSTLPSTSQSQSLIHSNPSTTVKRCSWHNPKIIMAAQKWNRSQLSYYFAPCKCRDRAIIIIGAPTAFLIGNWDRGRREQKLLCPLVS